MKKNAQNAGIDEVSFNDSAFKVRLKRNLEILSNVLANPTTVLGLIIVILMLAMAIFAPVITGVKKAVPGAAQLVKINKQQINNNFLNI